MQNNVPEGADLDVRNPCLEEEDLEEVEDLLYELYREDMWSKED